jgi:hypothetical protein
MGVRKIKQEFRPELSYNGVYEYEEKITKRFDTLSRIGLKIALWLGVILLAVHCLRKIGVLN